jgi:hypothetical protein
LVELRKSSEPKKPKEIYHYAANIIFTCLLNNQHAFFWFKTDLIKTKITIKRYFRIIMIHILPPSMHYFLSNLHLPVFVVTQSKKLKKCFLKLIFYGHYSFSRIWQYSYRKTIYSRKPLYPWHTIIPHIHFNTNYHYIDITKRLSQLNNFSPTAFIWLSSILLFSSSPPTHATES